MALDVTAFAALLKTYYTPEAVAKLVYENHPFLGIIQKQKMVTGQTFVSPIVYGSTANTSGTFANAIGGSNSVPSKAFSVTTADLFNSAVIDHKLIESSRTDKVAFARAVTVAVDGAMEDMSNVYSKALFGDGSGALGQISTIDKSGKVIVMTERAAVRQLQPGSFIVGDDLASMASPHAETLTVLTVDRDAGSFTYSGTDSNFAANHYIARLGSTANGISGLDAWLPSGTGRAAALAANFFGVVRSADAVRLGGIAYDASSESIEDALVGALQRCKDEGAKPKVILMSSPDYVKLLQAIAGKYVVGNVPAQAGGAKLSYDGITFATSSGNVSVLVDPDCVPGKAYILDTSTWKLVHLGASPISNSWDADGLESLRGTTTNTIEIRLFSYSNLVCSRPGHNAVVFNLS
jgi:hypothetical protein